jgi:protein-S-isoprenylcysteine O-methyltransferase Ste14
MNKTTHLIYIATFVIVILCWFVFAVLFIFRSRPAQGKKHKKDRTSILGIILVGLGFLLVFGARRTPYTPILPFGVVFDVIISAVAIAISVGSVWLVLFAVRTLGKQWSLSAQVLEQHQLVTGGPYQMVRHPIYSGMLGLMISTGLAMSTIGALLVAIIIALYGTTLRIRSEERLLREQFGKDFDDYASRVPPIIPRIWRMQ